MRLRSGVVLMLALLGSAVATFAQQVRLADICGVAWDQPELYAILKDGSDILPAGPDDYAIEVFVDTGASGLLLSKVIVDLFGLGQDDFIGIYTETGIAGEELGDVTRPFTFKMLNGSLTTAPFELPESDFTDYGAFNLWARRSADFLEWLDPINVAGMPVIGQRVMVIDPTPLQELDRIQTFLLPAGDPAIPTDQLDAHVPLSLQNFLPEPLPPGETLPSSAENPVIANVVLRHGLLSTTGTWLLDTGASSSFISIAQANAIGLTDGTTLDEILPQADFTLQIGGIGGTVTLPGFLIDEVRVPTTDGFDLAFRDVELLVTDVAELDGVFGMNFLVPSLSAFRDVDGPGYFERIVIDTASGLLGLDIFDDAFLICPPGDLDADGDVDLADWQLLVAACAGPATPTPNPDADLDHDGDCDMADMAVFTQHFGAQP